MAQWVQHKSGQGEKWEVVNGVSGSFYVTVFRDNGYAGYLPKSEYVPCDPPERWVDVTEQCTVVGSGNIILWGDTRLTEHTYFTRDCGDYRLRKVQLFRNATDALSIKAPEPQWAFIVEKKEQS